MPDDHEGVVIERRHLVFRRGDPQQTVADVVREVELFEAELQTCLERDAFQVDAADLGTPWSCREKRMPWDRRRLGCRR